MFSNDERVIYAKRQLVEVICQLRFPTILSIDTREPADFQETVREAFPRYQCQVETIPGVNGAPNRTINNHTFLSEDGGYKLSLTKDFIALSTMRYTHWEDFAARLDEPLGQFIKIYRPACFDRVGLRFVNAFSREQLDLAGRRLAEDGIVAAFRGIGAAVHDLVALGLQICLDVLLEGVAAVVAAERNFHRSFSYR